MCAPRTWIAAAGAAILSMALVAAVPRGQEPAQPERVEIPADATALEGIPTVQVETVEGRATRRVLSQTEAAGDRLDVGIVDGEFYWTSRENERLRVSSSGGFTYLSSEPGRYIRFTRLDDRIAYVEHLDTEFGSVTWWGEMKIVVGK